MKILIDGDGCPVIKIVEKNAKNKNLKVTILCDTNHVIKSEYSDIKVIDAGADAVDFALINICNEGDVVVTQDYGVAAMALGKSAYAIHQSGKWYTHNNIDQMLMERHINKVSRRKSSKHHIKGPKKRVEEDNIRFENSFTKLIESIID